MTEPSQYFKGRTVQEQMNEVIGYVDARSTEVASDVAAAKASEVLEPAEAAKDAAQAAQEAAEDAQTAAETAKAGAEAARDTTLAALPQVQSDIDALEGRMDTVELKVQTAEGNIVTIQGQIVALQTADGQNVKLTGTHAIGNYAVLLTGNQEKSGNLTMISRTDYTNRSVDIFNPPSFITRGITEIKAGANDNTTVVREEVVFANGGNSLAFTLHCGDTDGVTDHSATLRLTVFRDGKARLQLERESGTVQIVAQG